MFLNPSSLRAVAFAWPHRWLSNVSVSFATPTLALDAVSLHPSRCLPSVLFGRTEAWFSFVQGIKGFGSELGVRGRPDPWIQIISSGQIGVDLAIGGLHHKRGRLMFLLEFWLGRLTKDGGAQHRGKVVRRFLLSFLLPTTLFVWVSSPI